MQFPHIMIRAARLHNARFFSKIVERIKIVEVGPRDGLQNEKTPVPTELKLELINRLINSGLTCIEATSFVSPKWVPQMGDHDEILTRVLSLNTDVDFPVLIPNSKGLDKAIEVAQKAGKSLKEIAIFVACSEGFSKKNTNRSMQEAAEQMKPLIEKATQMGIRTRGYLSTVIACPYDGPTDPSIVAKLTKQLLDYGCYEVSLGDTIGVGTPQSVERMLKKVLEVAPASKLAIHAHDTYGQGVANVVQAVKMGLRTVDSSIAGLGGCPYAKGATGNVATEDVVYALEGLGYDTGINLQKLSQTGSWISSKLNRDYGSRAGKAIFNKM